MECSTWNTGASKRCALHVGIRHPMQMRLGLNIYEKSALGKAPERPQEGPDPQSGTTVPDIEGQCTKSLIFSDLR